MRPKKKRDPVLMVAMERALRATGITYWDGHAEGQKEAAAHWRKILKREISRYRRAQKREQWIDRWRAQFGRVKYEDQQIFRLNQRPSKPLPLP